ncbi:ParA family protein [Porphyromonas levii]|uniref:ParA family protein n=1 Tax=Porphyromonas levii TaxID=28114 RepID=UPI0003821FB8|nr:ParA family protein [Porphyromonas levii]
MKKKPIYIGMGSQKGGVGKSTIAEIMCSILHYTKGYNVLVIDCDDSQNSFTQLRRRDNLFIQQEEGIGLALKTQFQSYKKKAYNIIPSHIDKAFASASEWSEKLNSDIVVFDLPGRLNSVDLLFFSLRMDYVISPIEPDIQSMTSSMLYLRTLKESCTKIKDDRVQIKEIFALWNKISRSERRDTIENYTPLIKDLGVTLLDNVLYASKKFSLEVGEARNIKEVCRCTYLAPTQLQMEGTGIFEVIDEIERKIFQKSNT